MKNLLIINALNVVLVGRSYALGLSALRSQAGIVEVLRTG